MRILVLGEGPTDLGRFREDGSLDSEGVLPILVRKVLMEQMADVEIEFRAGNLGKIRTFKRRMGPTAHGYASKLQALLGLSEGRWAEAIVAVVDRDVKFHDRIIELNKGRDVLQENGKPCAVGLAFEEIEAWLLADEKALRTALGDDSIGQQPDPEELSSRDEASDHNPKGRLERLLENALGQSIPNSDFPDHYASIAQVIATQQLEERCPLGFCPFAQQVRELKIS